MAKTIPQLTDATTVGANDELIIQQGGITKRATGADLAKGLNAINGTVNVKDFGAVGDGVTDDTAAIQAAITHLGAAGGRVLLGRGSFKITATIAISTPIYLIGEGSGSYNQPTTAASTSLLWFGSNGGTMVAFDGNGTLFAGGEISNVALNGRAIAGTGLYVRDHQRLYSRNLTVTGTSVYGIWFTNTAISDPTARWIFEDTRISLRGGATQNATGIGIDGITAPDSGGVTLGTFRRTVIEHANGHGVYIGERGDGIVWESLQTFRSNSETGWGVWYAAGNSTSIIDDHNFIGTTLISSGIRSDSSGRRMPFRCAALDDANTNTSYRSVFGVGEANADIQTTNGFAYGLQGLLPNINVTSSRDNMTFVRYDSSNTVLHTAHGNWFATLSGSGAIADAEQRGGAIRLTTGATSGNVTTLSDVASISNGSGWSPRRSISSCFTLSLLAGNLTNTVVRVGFANSTGDDPTDGIYFEWSPSVNAKWRAICIKDSVKTEVITPLDGFFGWISFYIHVSQEGDTATFFTRTSENKLFGTGAVITTNVPGDALPAMARIKTLTNEARSFDWYSFACSSLNEPAP